MSKTIEQDLMLSIRTYIKELRTDNADIYSLDVADRLEEIINRRLREEEERTAIEAERAKWRDYYNGEY